MHLKSFTAMLFVFSLIDGVAGSDCCKSCSLTVSSIIPWIIIAFLSYMFYHHLKLYCGITKTRTIQNEMKNASSRGRHLYEQVDVGATIDRVRSLPSLASDSDGGSSVRVLDPNNNDRIRSIFCDNHLPVTGDQFRGYMHIVTEFAIEYLCNTQNYNVTTDSRPGFIYSKLPAKMPKKQEKFSVILSDLYEQILPGLAHWLHPQFHGYYPTGASYPDIIAETVISAIAVACFSWDSAPSLTELEVVMMNWMGRAIGLPDDFLFKGRAFESKGGGAIQPSASDAVFIAIVAARTKKLRELVGADDPDRFAKEAEVLGKLVAYASVEAHTCIDKACKLAMVRLRAIPGSPDKFSMQGEALEREVVKDLERGLIPFVVHCTAGTTASCSFDELDECCRVAKKYNMWAHVDAAYAGSALICPEFRHLMRGYEMADSINVNAHKMLLCSVTCAFFWTKHQAIIKETLVIEPLYLRRTHDSMDFRNWSICLSRRGKALKLWFLFRMYGLSHLQEYVRRLVRLAGRFKSHLETDDRIEIVGEQNLSVVCFRIKHDNFAIANQRTNDLCKFINKSNRIFITHASPNNIGVVRLCFGQERLSDSTIDESWRIIKQLIDEFFAIGSSKRSSDGKFLYETDRDFQLSPAPSIEVTQRTTMSPSHHHEE